MQHRTFGYEIFAAFPLSYPFRLANQRHSAQEQLRGEPQLDLSDMGQELYRTTIYDHRQTEPSPSGLDLSIFPDSGEMGVLMREFDWRDTPLGAVEDWPQSLKTSVGICLTSRFPIVLYWGPEYAVLYNDAYSQILGAKHPWALGQTCRSCWAEIWDTIGPMLDGVVKTGTATWSDDLLLMLERFGYPEECYFSFSFSPIQVEGGAIGGIFTAVIETTDKVIGERRLRTLRDLAASAVTATSEEEGWLNAAAALTENRKDIPFAILCKVRENRLHVVGTSGITPTHSVCQELSRPDSELEGKALRAARFGETVEVDLSSWAPELPCGPWESPAKAAVLLPITTLGQGCSGVLVAAVSPAKALDESYRTFFSLMARQIATSVADARSNEQERKRAEALAELDRAKTVFFSNISHELRTPLTLLLGPTESALAAKDGALRGAELEMVHRNELRLLKLVNTLLDFSRIEAGQLQAAYEATDLCVLTEDIASIFRSTMEKAGLKFTVECEELDGPVYVDREMWEKIVLNLLSNAFKFTFSGTVALTLRNGGDMVELAVADSGVGIPEAELPHVFERFRRVESTRARTHEGTGIGLALVEELVRLHGGSVSVKSVVGRGSAFYVTIPKGADHLPAERIGARRTFSSTTLNREMYVEEAAQWLSGASCPTLPETPSSHDRPRILVADDNADMRAYVTHLMAKTYEVLAAADGEEAIEMTRRLRPALILTDVMMPGVDGFGLLRAVRNDPDLRDTPVIMLSARAGEEARVDGLDAGADDYLVKPFTAREMLARVAAHLRFAKLRDEAARRERRLETDKTEAQHALAESERRFRALASASTQSLYRMSPNWKEMRQLRGEGFLSDTDAPNPDWMEEYILAEDRPMVQAAIDKAISAGSLFELEHRVRRADGSEGWVLSRAVPIRDEQQQVAEWFGAAIDVTERVQTRKQLEQKRLQLERSLVAARHLAAIVESSEDAIVSKSLQGVVTSWNLRAEQLFGYTAHEMIGDSIKRIVPPELMDEEDRILATIQRGERIEHFETVRMHKDGRRIDVALTISPIRDEAGHIVGASKIARDITEKKRTEQVLRVTERLASVGKLAATVAHEINNPLEAVTNLLYLAKYSNDVEQTRAFITQADEELKRVALLTRQTLGFSRETKDPSRMRVGPAIQSLVELFFAKVRNKRIQLKTEIRQDPEIIGLEGEVRRLVANLLSNSIDAVGEHGIIRIRLSAGRAWDGSNERGVRFTIADTGTGIAPEHRERMFEPFFTTKKDVGTGLGLWISKGIVNSHHGKITVRSCLQPGKTGTVFSLFLPLQHEPAPQAR